MGAFATWAGTSVGLATLAALALAGGWLALRLAGVRRWTSLSDLLVVVAVVTIVVLTLRPGQGVRPTAPWQVLPFADLAWAVGAGSRALALALADIIGNLVLFLPLGGAIALRWPRTGGRRAVAVGVVVSLAIEVTQWLLPLGRTAQTTDVLMNGLGVWFAWLVIVALRGSAVVSAVGRRRR